MRGFPVTTREDDEDDPVQSDSRTVNRLVKSERGGPSHRNTEHKNIHRVDGKQIVGGSGRLTGSRVGSDMRTPRSLTNTVLSYSLFFRSQYKRKCDNPSR